MNAGKIIEMERINACMSQIELSKKMKVHQSKISLMENGKCRVSVEEFEKALKIFKRKLVVV
jgi:ribosome-binding protein aMBF1 (putative translation factor)